MKSFKLRSSLLSLAKNILDAFLEHYGSETKYQETEGRLLSQDETELFFNDYISELEIKDRVTLNFSERCVAPTSVTHDSKTGKSKINIGMPIEYREGRIMGTLHHELGTHFLRKYNE